MPAVCNLFTYGTLMVPEVMHTVTGQTYRFTPATLTGYGRYAITGEVYPAISPDPAGTVTGVLYLDLDDRVIRVLDEFESQIYTRQEVQVKNREQVQVQVQAWAYVIAPDYRYMLSGNDWDPERFRSRDLQDYLKGISG